MDLHEKQFQLMMRLWREENPGSEPDGSTEERLRIQARMIVDDVARAQSYER
ncbi:hypothetical protein MBRU_16150 [Mycolicibacterium brumae DSM 44177]|nr:hypothetical protein MBRU_16150 [Mycolicibacterium brumae DSM 44177]